MRDFFDFFSGGFSFVLESSSNLRRWSRSVLLSFIGGEDDVLPLVPCGECVVLWDAFAEWGGVAICREGGGVFWVSSLSCRGSLVVVLRALCGGMGVSGVAGCVELLPCVWCMVSCVQSSGVSVISRLRLGFKGHVCVVM